MSEVPAQGVSIAFKIVLLKRYVKITDISKTAVMTKGDDWGWFV